MRYEEVEKKHDELFVFYNEAKEKICRLDEKIKENTREKVSFERRTRELANLLETLEHFDLDVKTLCRFTAEAVANLTKVEPLFEEAVKKLRQFTWKVNEREYDNETDKLKSQNLVLREIIKSLKRKVLTPINCSKMKILQSSFQCKQCSLTRCNLENKNIVSKSVDKKVLCIESHKNGISYDEYVIGFSNTRQMKIKHSPMTSAKVAHLKLEIFDCEEKYHESSPDKVVILLKNLSTSIKVERTGINCATQTALTRKCDNYTQTSITQIRDFLRLNVGHTMLNSEKRAIERNLSNLERTVDRLKCNTLHHARSMIENKSKCLRKEEFLECIERLTGG
ncbi:uncharacterized protein LOC122524266 [Polistes fuscatus]|uniref:uncharacterized protein LOC122524266 n=1 Tax=Polistes fuscatus TaxID=30207 RepID=UPI001CA7D99D|nr:uncharacterized protein LOC122524266 [Polistes fuscatus]